MSTANTSLSQQLDEKPWVDALDNSSVQEYQGFDATASHNIQDLARKLTHGSTNGDHHSTNDLARYLSHMSDIPGVSPFNGNISHEQLDPDSENFNAKYWVKNLKNYLNLILIIISHRN